METRVLWVDCDTHLCVGNKSVLRQRRCRWTGCARRRLEDATLTSRTFGCSLTDTWTSRGKGPAMLPVSVCQTSAPNSFVSSYLNTPEEDDETMNTEGPETSSVPKPDSAPNLPKPAAASDGAALSRQRWMEEQDRTLHPAASSLFSSQLPHSLPTGYCQPTPFPSQVRLLHPSFASSGSGYPNSLPSYLNQKDDFSCSEKSCFSKSVSLPGQHGGSMSSFEQPMSLRSNPPSAEFYQHTFSPYSCLPHGPVCCPQHPADAFSRRPPHHPAYSPFYPGDCRLPDPGFTQLGRSSPAKERRPAYSMPLSLEQSKIHR
ncbi:hypothetical protein OJAV_G00038430 [Oryzias javanicus]|uniref:Uncharacterized protein n=1 Tax=Oryzias javanicus TaxID=123683 RepID=A0A3S2N516_ORYJA|nr:hypothetical protein OJAV_G00038430 [Oryzias javanicus]